MAEPTIGANDPAARPLVAVALRGLASAGFLPGEAMPFTLRGVPGLRGPRRRPQGRSLRYSAIAALGLGRVPLEAQLETLNGWDASTLARHCLALAEDTDDPGALALSLWAAAETAGASDAGLAARLLAAVRGPSIASVDCAWAVVAGLAMPATKTAADVVAEGVARLLAGQSTAGLFPHALPQPGGVRGHVGSFADQIYPIQALARFVLRTGDPRALAAAESTAGRLVALQGTGGQWWWHYDVRTGQVTERYPVYSVHQHGMAPMVLADLAACGGTDYAVPMRRGLDWLETHPECVEPLIAPALGVVWRKVGRREPLKAARTLAAVASRVRPGTEVPGVDRLWPAGRVDYECRPYELGWLLYASG